MESQNKYYTPTIEEFHIGFEYEFKHPDYEVWNKYTTPEFQMEREDCIPFVGNLNNFRVKYLDQEDIESLGWVYNEEYDCYFYQTSPTIKAWKLYVINEQLDIEILCFGECTFSGTIKNKSELKRLMKQLGIHE